MTIWYVVELSSPVDISSMNRAFVGPTIISPAKGGRVFMSDQHHIGIRVKQIKLISYKHTSGDAFLLASRDAPMHAVTNKDVRTHIQSQNLKCKGT